MHKLFAKCTTAFLTLASTLLCGMDYQTSFKVGAGYRHDDLNFKRVLDGSVFLDNPNFVTPIGETSNSANTDFVFKTDLHNLDLGLITGSFKTIVNRCFYVRADADFGWIQPRYYKNHLEMRHHDVFDLCAKNAAIYDSSDQHRFKYGCVSDLAIGAGIPFQLLCDKMLFAPLFGFSWNNQEIRQKGHCSVIQAYFPDADVSSGGSFATRYRAMWYGPWAGFDFTLNLTNAINLYGQFGYQWGHCRFKTNTHNQITGTTKVKKTTHAHGVSTKLGLDYYVSCDLSVGANVNYNYRRASSKTQIIDWSALGFGLDAGYAF